VTKAHLEQKLGLHDVVYAGVAIRSKKRSEF
jgi:hypothetical protein